MYVSKIYCLFDFFAYKCSDIGLMLEQYNVFKSKELNDESPGLDQQKNITNARAFYEELNT